MPPNCKSPRWPTWSIVENGCRCRMRSNLRRALWSAARQEKYVSASGTEANNFSARGGNSTSSRRRDETGMVSKKGGIGPDTSGCCSAKPRSWASRASKYEQAASSSGTARSLAPTLRAFSTMDFWDCERGIGRSALPTRTTTADAAPTTCNGPQPPRLSAAAPGSSRRRLSRQTTSGRLPPACCGRPDRASPS